MIKRAIFFFGESLDGINLGNLTDVEKGKPSHKSVFRRLYKITQHMFSLAMTLFLSSRRVTQETSAAQSAAL